MEPIGTVTGINPITPYEFYVRLNVEDGKPLHILQIDEIVQAEYEYKRFGRLRIYGVVVEATCRWDQNDITGYKEEIISSGGMVGIPIYLAKVSTTRIMRYSNEEWIEDEIPVPPPAGTPITPVKGDETDISLGFDKLKEKGKALPIGVLMNQHVAYLDTDYILGNNGAHINVSGLSGVAAKTSYTTFLIYSMLNSTTIPKELAYSRFIIFNVKGEGLLFLDRWNREWKEKEKKQDEDFQKWCRMFDSMGLKPGVFQNVEFYAPMKRENKPDVNYRVDGAVKGFGWDALDVVTLGLIEFLFDPRELSDNVNIQLTVSALSEILERNYFSMKIEILKKLKNSSKKEEEEKKGEKVHIGYDIDGLSDDQKVRAYLRAIGYEPARCLEEHGVPPSIDALANLLKDPRVKEELKEEEIVDKTIAAVYRRIKAAQKLDIGKVWVKLDRDLFTSPSKYEEPSYHINWDRKGGITVIDISKLRHRAQIFVVGSILKQVLQKKEAGLVKEPVFIYLDELNKYAPRIGGGPLGDVFRDIAERGRSFKIILIGAEQTASEVDYRVVTQASTTVVGRQKLAELKKDEYAHLVGAQKDKAAHLVQGEVIVDQPFLRVPLLVKFPLTPWSTREDAETSGRSENFDDFT